MGRGNGDGFFGRVEENGIANLGVLLVLAWMGVYNRETAFC